MHLAYLEIQLRKYLRSYIFNSLNSTKYNFQILCLHSFKDENFIRQMALSIVLNILGKSNSDVWFNSFQHIDGYVGDSLMNFVFQVSQGSRTIVVDNGF